MKSVPGHFAMRNLHLSPEEFWLFPSVFPDWQDLKEFRYVETDNQFPHFLQVKIQPYFCILYVQHKVDSD